MSRCVGTDEQERREEEEYKEKAEEKLEPHTDREQKIYVAYQLQANKRASYKRNLAPPERSTLGK